MNTQPEALRLAEMFERIWEGQSNIDTEAAAELRRLHSVNAELLEVLNKLEYSYEGNIKRYPTEVEVNAAIAKAQE
jgi:hypothetical protein